MMCLHAERLLEKVDSKKPKITVQVSMVKVHTAVDPILQTRLRNCLQTILDLRENMDSAAYGDTFEHELEMIKIFLSRAKDVPVTLKDVERIEHATGAFLSELHDIMRVKPLPYMHTGTRLQ